MQGAPTRYVSLTELYTTDEVELLLDEIRDLEPTSCRGEDIQDLEIAGSGCGGGGGGRSPAGTEATERSWDSHAHYSRAVRPLRAPIAPLYCRLDLLLSVRGALALLLITCSVGSCSAAWTAVGLRVNVPLPGRVRSLLLGGLTSLLIHGALTVSRVTRLEALLPLNWDAVEGASALWSAVSLSCGGVLTLHALTAEPEYEGAPRSLVEPLQWASAFALCGAAVALALTVRCFSSCASRRNSYRAVPMSPPPPPEPAPSTSRDDPL